MRIETKEFVTPDGVVCECHAIIHAEDPRAAFSEQLSEIQRGLSELVKRYDDMRPVFCRWFLSDATNQACDLPQLEWPSSVVQQPPLDGTKTALWLYLQKPGSGHYRHYWQGNRCRPATDSLTATRTMLNDYAHELEEAGCTLAGNCVRTWFFVHDVDVNYAGVVNGRNEVFGNNGLTSQTHFISSTGIGGAHADTSVSVQLDTYAVGGLREGQMRYLYAKEWLNPTYEYGVAFERGTMVDYGDRRHVFISGTASIDNRGEVLFKGDIRRQTMRMLQNVEALLAEAGCDWNHVGHFIVYLRDTADYAVVDSMFRERFPEIPYVIVYAPVCRPQWLIETECMAFKPIRSHYAEF